MANAERERGHLRADIQGLRAVAVLGVVFFHADRWFDGGFVGVDVFFVISGFVIAGSILRRRNDRGTFSLVDFYRRRALRILPALVTFLLLSIPLTLLGPADTVRAGANTASAAALFIANIQLMSLDGVSYFAASSELNPYLHTWSLSVEEQFYFGFPFLLLVGFWWAKGRGLRRVTALTSLAAVGSFLLMGLALAGGKQDAAFYLAPTRAWEFLAGALLAVVGFESASAAKATVLRFGGLAVIAYTMVVADGAAWPGSLTIVTVAGSVAVIAAGAELGAGRSLLDNPVMRFLGDISYSWYLWHWPLAVVARTGAPQLGWLDDAAVVLAIVPAWLSLRFIEEPIRRRSDLSTARIFTLSAVGLAVAVVAAGALTPALGDRLPGSVDDLEDVASVDHVYEVDGCPNGEPDASASNDLCGTADDGARTAALIGDSVASQVAAPFGRAARDAGLNPLARSRTSCAYLPELELLLRGKPVEGCTAHNDELREFLLETRPEIVVVSNKLSFSLTQANYSIATSDGSVTADPAGRELLVTESYRIMVRELQAVGTEVVLLRRTPPIEAFNLRECARWRWLVDEAGCGTTDSLDVARARRSAEDRVLDTVAAEFGLTVLDYDAQLCPTECASFDERGWVYTDGGHVTQQFAEQLAPVFAPIFEPAGG